MDKKPELFSKEFKSLWDPGSKVRTLWDALEVFFSRIKEMAHEQAVKLSQSRSIDKIDQDIQNGNLPMEELFKEWVNLLFNRITLRTLLKARDALQLLFFSCNTGNEYGCALASRSILEHVALLEYLVSRIPWKSKPVVQKENLIQFTKNINNLAFGSRFKWNKLLSEPSAIRQLLSSGNWNRPHDERIPPNTELIKALDKKLLTLKRIIRKDQLLFTYCILCDVIHPSWGGDFIYSPKMYKEMISNQNLDEHFKLSATLFCLPVVEFVRYLVVLCEDFNKYELKKIA